MLQQDQLNGQLIRNYTMKKKERDKMNEYGGCLPFEVRKNKLYWEKFSNN